MSARRPSSRTWMRMSIGQGYRSCFASRRLSRTSSRSSPAVGKKTSTRSGRSPAATHSESWRGGDAGPFGLSSRQRLKVNRATPM